MAADPLHPNHLFGHVQDADYFHLPRQFGDHGHVVLPQPLKTDAPLWTLHTGFGPLDAIVEPLELRLTKFMVIEALLGVVLCLIFIRLASKMASGRSPRGRLWHLLEAMLVFIRDEVARPAIGKKDADRFLPLLWTIFFFVLGCNLAGMVPWLGSPTGAFATTGTLAIMTFLAVIGAGMMRLGIVGFWKAQVPHMDLPLPLAIPLKPMIFAIELLGLGIKHFVLAIRLLANMMAGHIVIAVILAFIAASASSVAFYGVAPASVLGAVAISLLELFVAFLQAYIFVFLSALFIGMAVHPH